MLFPIDHDLHTHTQLSACSGDPTMTNAALLSHAKASGYKYQCVTDHLWDSLVPDPSNWYAPQNVEHVKQALPLPEDDEVKMIFGCETEFCGGKKLGLHPSHFDDFDFIIIPPNHFHMLRFTRDPSCDTEEKVAELFTTRLEEITLLDLPWHKVGIAHMDSSLLFREGDSFKVLDIMNEKRLKSVFEFFAKQGAGIELNLAGFGQLSWDHRDSTFRLFHIAKAAGCKFYLGSDAHHPSDLDRIPEKAGKVIAELGLTADDLYRIPE